MPARDGDPICDKFAVDVWDRRVFAVIADGCGWGKKPFEASNNGVNAFMEYVRCVFIIIVMVI